MREDFFENREIVLLETRLPHLLRAKCDAQSVILRLLRRLCYVVDRQNVRFCAGEAIDCGITDFTQVNGNKPTCDLPLDLCILK